MSPTERSLLLSPAAPVRVVCTCQCAAPDPELNVERPNLRPSKSIESPVAPAPPGQLLATQRGLSRRDARVRTLDASLPPRVEEMKTSTVDRRRRHSSTGFSSTTRSLSYPRSICSLPILAVLPADPLSFPACPHEFPSRRSRIASRSSLSRCAFPDHTPPLRVTSCHGS